MAGDGGRAPDVRWNAPWTDEQVAALAEYQASGRFHPYTCGADSSHGPLTPSREGWACESCPYTQGWAHAHGRAPDVSEQRAELEAGIKAATDVLRKSWGFSSAYNARTAIAAYLSNADPASVLAALLAEQPDATIAALETLLTSDEVIAAVAAAQYAAERDIAVDPSMYANSLVRDEYTRFAAIGMVAACHSLRPKAPKEDRDA
jgi:hypothetical protein